MPTNWKNHEEVYKIGYEYLIKGSELMDKDYMQSMDSFNLYLRNLLFLSRLESDVSKGSGLMICVEEIKQIICNLTVLESINSSRLRNSVPHTHFSKTMLQTIKSSLSVLLSQKNYDGMLIIVCP